MEVQAEEMAQQVATRKGESAIEGARVPKSP